MYTPSARQGTFFLVVVLLLVSILLEQAIAALCPWLSQLGGVRPMIVFLDIPLEAPLNIDWLPVGFIFIIFYSIVGGKGTFRRGWAILGRWWLLLIFLLIGGGIYSGLSGFLPKTIRNGIQSFGMRADLTLPYPSGETVHLQGSMIMLVFFILGWRLLINKAAPPAVATPPPPPIPAETALPYRGRIAMRIPEPVEVKSPDDRRCVYVSMPAGFQRKHPSYPCIVEDGIKPAGFFRSLEA
ncbi:MAG TPA: hypothetical protein VFE32_13465 [Puia sp.]|jgi:hypothetical protein|nr:hypothetical protein [Puia sp.]